MSNPKLALTLPTKDGCQTFDMATHKLIVRIDPAAYQCVILIDREGRVAYSLNNVSQDFRSALVLVGKFLADNPVY